MKKSLLLSLLLTALALPGFSQTFTEWQDPHVNAINRLPMHSTFLADEAGCISLAGDWDFLWVRSANQRPEG
ncbi:MAG: hypothetical protein IIT99_03240, partial [Bacteroidales bacterium]|nr:hypothetical protein [Bacteroidales bacterium]